MQFLKRLQDIAEELDTTDPNIKKPLDALLQAIQSKQVDQNKPGVPDNPANPAEPDNSVDPANPANSAVPPKPVKPLSRSQQETIANTVAAIARQSGVDPKLVQRQLNAKKPIGGV